MEVIVGAFVTYNDQRKSAGTRTFVYLQIFIFTIL